MTRHEWIVQQDAAGRLDLYLAERLDLSRNRVHQLLAEGRVRVDGSRPKKRDPVTEGQRIEVEVPDPAPIEAAPEPIPLDVLYEDEDMAIIDKPAGLVTHPAPGHPTGTLVNALLYQLGELSGIGGALRPGIVHRLDKDTSGLMAVAKSDAAHRALSDALKAREVKRVYLTALWGRLDPDEVEVDAPIGRDSRDRKRMTVREDGRSARSTFQVVERWRAASFCRVRLHSGRTHQIRVHAVHLGHPVVGDPLYGAGREKGFSGDARPWASKLARDVPRQFLHAAELRLRHPVTGDEMAFSSPLPEDLARVRRWALGSTA